MSEFVDICYAAYDRHDPNPAREIKTLLSDSGIRVEYVNSGSPKSKRIRVHKDDLKKTAKVLRKGGHFSIAREIEFDLVG